MGLDFNWIVPGLAQGAYPDPAEGFKQFDVIVYCAEEKQPRAKGAPPGKALYKLPLDDDPYQQVPPDVGMILHRVGRGTAAHLVAGQRVLSTCAMGLNRSGLISSLTLMYALNMPARDAIRLIRQKRSPDALCNPMFEQFLLNTRLVR